MFAWGAVAEVDLAGGDFVAVDEAAVQAQMISAGHAGAQYGGLVVYGYAASANPVLRLAT